MTLHFQVHDILTQEPLGELDPFDWKFNDPIWGRGSCDLKISIDQRDSLRRRTQPNRVSLYVRDDDGRYYFGGWIRYRSHKPGDNFISVRVPDWRSWLDWRLYRDRVFQSDYDQYQMAYDLVGFAIAEFTSTPRIVIPTARAGLKRQFTIQPGWSVAKALDSFGRRDGGFEWRVAFRDGVNGNPELLFEVFPQGGERSSRPTLSLDARDTQNRVGVGEIAEDATESITRAWAINDGTYPDRLESKDPDPALGGGNVLLVEAEITASGVKDPSTLYDYARALRVVSAVPFTTLPVTHPTEQPPISSYQPGDRARLIIHDEWDDLDITGVRVADRALAGGRDKVTTSTVVLDMTDIRDIA